MAVASAIPLYVVDAFAERPFSGNPAAVCLLDAWPAAPWLHSLAAEMNLSETAFLVGHGENYELRWLTPKVEVALCGHATLASAAVLWHTGRARADAAIRFSTRSGILSASRRGELVELDFPLDPVEQTAAPSDLLAALGVDARSVGRGRTDFVVELGSEAELRTVAPDFSRLAKVECRGIIITARPTANPSISCRASSRRPPASTKIRSPARPIACWPISGGSGWTNRSSLRFRRRREAERSTCESRATAFDLAGGP